MKPITKIALIGGSAFILWKWIGRTAITAYNLQYGIASFNIVSLTPESVRLNIGLKVTNRMPFTILLRELRDVKISFNGNQVASIDAMINRNIYGNSETVLPVVVEIDYRAFSSEVWNHIQAGGRIDNWLINIRAKVTADNVSNIPLNINFYWDNIISAFAGTDGIGRITTEKQAQAFARNFGRKLDRGEAPSSYAEELMHDAFRKSGYNWRSAGSHYFKQLKNS